MRHEPIRLDRDRTRRAILAVLVSATFIGPAGQASAQEGRRATGLLLTPQEKLESLPRAPRMRAFLPEAADLSNRFPVPGDQGEIKSCVGWAVGYAARSYYEVPGTGARRPDREHTVSPGYVYNAIRDGDCDAGSYTSDALDLLREKGALSYPRFPNRGSGACRRPSQVEESEATGFRIISWLSVPTTTPDMVKQELANGHPVIVGLQLTDSFFKLGSRAWDPGPGQMPLENAGHAVTITGYDDRSQAFRFINSWGRDWGRGGYGRLSYDAFVEFANEAYVMRTREPPRPDPPPKPDLDIPTVELDLPGLECSKLKTARVDGSLVLAGFVASAEDLGRWPKGKPPKFRLIREAERHFRLAEG